MVITITVSTSETNKNEALKILINMLSGETENNAIDHDLNLMVNEDPVTYAYVHFE